MTSQAIRDPLADHLITPQNAALVLIDYQPSQWFGHGHEDRAIGAERGARRMPAVADQPQVEHREAFLKRRDRSHGCDLGCGAINVPCGEWHLPLLVVLDYGLHYCPSRLRGVPRLRESEDALARKAAVPVGRLPGASNVPSVRCHGPGRSHVAGPLFMVGAHPTPDSGRPQHHCDGARASKGSRTAGTRHGKTLWDRERKVTQYGDIANFRRYGTKLGSRS